MINVALIGKGYWGEKYIKTLTNISDVNLVSICTYNYNEILKNENIDCVIIVTPAETHFQIIKDCLLAKKHVLVEKPFMLDSKNVAELKKIMSDNLILQVGHIYLYHDGILQLKKLIKNGVLGEIESVFSIRMSISKYPNALWEMGTHDLYILDYLFENYVTKENKIMGDINHCIFNMQYKKVLYEPYVREHIINAYITVCSYYPGKKREMIINGTKKRAIFDDEAKTKLYVIDKKNNLQECITIDETISPLEKQCRNFFRCIETGDNPKSGVYEGFKNIRSLELLNKML